MRELEEIDSRLRLAALVRATAREFGDSPSMSGVDALLDERLQAVAESAR